MPKVSPVEKKAIETLVEKVKPTAKKSGAKTMRSKASKALKSAKWVEKSAPKDEKKAVAALEKAIDEFCVEDGLKEVEMQLNQKQPAAKVIKLQKAGVMVAEKAVKQACSQLPPPVQKAVEKEIKSSFSDALKFWKDLESHAKKAGLN